MAGSRRYPWKQLTAGPGFPGSRASVGSQGRAHLLAAAHPDRDLPSRTDAAHNGKSILFLLLWSVGLRNNYSVKEEMGARH